MKPPWVLMYHAVEPYEEDPLLVCVSPARFRLQMRWIFERGLRAVSIRDLRERARVGRASGLIGLTFDDGYAGLVEHVYPVLHDYDFTATVFAVAGRLGGTNDWDWGPQRTLLGAEELTALATERFEIGSHGISHTAMAGLSSSQLLRETAESRSILRERTGAAIDGFCYPYGSADVAAVRAVREAGYGYACAVSPQKHDGRFLIPRAFIGESDGPLRLRAKLAVHRMGLRRPRSSQ